jgi:hypothetical protein
LDKKILDVKIVVDNDRDRAIDDFDVEFVLLTRLLAWSIDIFEFVFEMICVDVDSELI